MTEPVYWLNGRLVTGTDAGVPLNDHGLLYGDGVFEGIRFYNGRPLRLAAHLDRLESSARALMLKLPSRTELQAGVDAAITAFDQPEGYLRLVVTRGPGGLGLDPTQCEQPNLFIIADRVALAEDAKRRAGLDLITASTRRPGPTVLDPRIKSLNYLNNILARMEAYRAGADEAVLLNERGFVAEGSAENIFVVRNDRLLTPPVSDGALDGITRGIILELCREEGMEAAERSLTLYDIHTADECFLCGTGAEILPVRSVDGRRMKQSPGLLTRRLEGAFHRLVEEETRS